MGALELDSLSHHEDAVMKYGIRYHDKRWWVYEVAVNRILPTSYFFRFTAQWACNRLNETERAFNE